MTNYGYPASIEIKEIEQVKLPRLLAGRVGLELMPMVDEDNYILEWEQMDNFSGLQQVRGLNGDPGRVQALGHNQFQMQPGVYGEFRNIDEAQLTRRRQIGTFGTPIDISDLVMNAQDHLLERRLDRIEKIIWDLLLNGSFSVAGYDGNGAPVIMHTDTFPIQTYTAAVPWSTFATAQPLNDLRAIKILARGKSTNLGSGARVIVNATTANNMYNNSNSADLYGRRQGGFGTYNNLNEINGLFTGDGLANVEIYDEGWYDSTGTFNLFIPTGKGVVIGKRTSGAPIGQYRMIRNANNPDMAPGAYSKVIDTGVNTVPRNINVHDGHNGGPALFFPGSVVSINV